MSVHGHVSSVMPLHAAHSSAAVQVPILLVHTSEQQVCLEAAAAGLKEGGPLCGEVVGVLETLVRNL